MAQKQGGKGKSSSPSDINYWKRVNAETQKQKRITRHARRMGMTKQQITDSQASQVFPHIRIPLPLQSYVMSGNKPPNQSGIFLHILECDGRILEVSPHRADAESAKGSLLPGLPFHHYLLNPVSGEKTLLQARNFN